MQPIETFCTLLCDEKVSTQKDGAFIPILSHIFCFRSKGTDESRKETKFSTNESRKETKFSTNESRKETKFSVTYLPHVFCRKSKAILNPEG